MALKTKQRKQQKSRHAEYKKCQNQRHQRQSEHKKAVLLMNEGKTLAHLGQHGTATQKYRQALQINPFFVDALINYGVSLVELGQLDEALIQYKQALQIHPTSVLALINYGSTLSELGMPEEGFSYYRRALQIQPDSILALSNYGNILVNLGRYEEALPFYRQVLIISPDSFETLINLGYSLTGLERHKEAIVQYQRASQIAPLSSIALTNYGISLSSLEQNEEALIQFRRALEIDPDAILAIKNYAVSLTKLGLHKDAVVYYKKALHIEPTSVITLINYGISLGLLEEHEKAVTQFQKALQIDPNSTIALKNYGITLVRLKRYEEAIAQFEYLLKNISEDSASLLNYGMALTATKQYYKAINIFKLLLEKEGTPESHLKTFYTIIGVLYYRIKSAIDGNEYFRLAIEHAEDKDATRLRIAQEIFSVKPFSKDGVEILKEVATTSPYYREAFETLKFNLDIEAFFDMFNAPSPDDFQDTRELYRAIYHKMINELFILKAILYEMEADAGSNAAPITSIIQRVEAMLEELNAKRDEEKINLRQIPEHDYQRMLALIAHTAHDISDVISNSFFRLKADILLLREETLPNSPLAQQIERIFTHIETTERALNDLKSVQEGIALHGSTFAIKDIFETWQQTPKFQNASIELEIHDRDAEFYGDLPKIRSMVNELIENAVKHNAEQTNLRILIATQKTTNPISNEDQSYLHLAISDNGKGIPDEKKEWVFLPMKTTAPQHGSGLGLFIIKRTVNAMGGNIQETGKFGEGTRFEIYLPWKETHERRA